MPTKEILFNKEARQAIKKGVDKIANAVASSLGAKGRNIIIGNRGTSHITKDGVSIVRAINLTDGKEAIGANIIKEASFLTLRSSGDGTSTAAVLAQSIFNEGIKVLDRKKWWMFWSNEQAVNPIQLKNGIDKASKKVIECLEWMSERIDIKSDKLKQIATISANNDEEIGGFVSDAIQRTGEDGVVKVETSNTGTTYVKIVEGLNVPSGFTSPYFVTNSENITCQLNNPYILIAEGKLSSEKDLMPIFQQVAKESRPFLIIAEMVDDAALSLVMHNRIKGNYPVCIVRAPGFGEAQKTMIKDIGVVVGANVCNDETGLRPDLLKLTDLGTAEKVIIGKDETTIIGGGGKKHDIESHVAQVRKALDLSQGDYEIKQNEGRLAKLLGGIGIIYVGGASEIEISEKLDRYDDALRAAKCAIRGGVLVGGGCTFLRCIDALKHLEVSNKDEMEGVKLIQKTLKAPFIQMAKNAGLQNKVTVDEILVRQNNMGYNFKTDKYEDLYEAGILDPTLVVISSFKNAASVAGTLLTSEVLIVNWDDNPQHIQK